MLVVYPVPEHNEQAKVYLPRYQAWKSVEEVCIECHARCTRAFKSSHCCRNCFWTAWACKRDFSWRAEKQLILRREGYWVCWKNLQISRAWWCTQISGKKQTLCLSPSLSLGNNLRLIICYNCTQACRELRNEKDPNAPTRVMCAVVDGDEEATTLWDLSWALNTLGHSIVKINTFDWILAVKHARAMM